ncbi:tape measure domain-containing protein [Pseudomonas nitroreducens]|uniref:Tape measure domain-containing protein n=2 Tax=Pseudomonas nitroreducens TaxID=46680 RepID=A0A2D0AFH3_PSENT|nr:tape measure domain-containing protein [Pseudomonas nitroreducens]
MRDTQATVDDLTREFGDNEHATAGQRIALREARKAADDAARAYRTNQTAVRNLTGTLTAAGVSTDDLQGEERRLTEAIDQGKVALGEKRTELRDVIAAEKAAGQAADEHRSRVDAVRTAMVSGVRQAALYAAGFIGIQAALGLVRSGIETVRGGIVSMLQTGDRFENLQNRLTALMGSVEGGQKATAWIKTFAKDTPLQLSDVTDAFALLKAYGVDPMNGSLKSIEDMSEKLGGGMERLQGIVTAVGQAWAKEKLQTEEILQLVERGVPVWDMLGKVTGKTTAQLQDLATKGKLGRDVIKGLLDEMGRSSEGAAAKAMGTLTGLVSNLGDTATDFLDRIAKSGALEYAKDRLKDLSTTIAQMDADGRLDRLARSLSDAFVVGGQKILEYVAKLGEVDFSNLVTKAESVAKAIGPAIDTVATTGKAVVSTLTTVWNGFSLLVSSTAATLSKGLQVTIGNLALGAGQIAGFFGGSELQAKAEGLYTFLGELSQGYVDQAKTDLSQIEDAWSFLSDTAQSTAQEQTATTAAELTAQQQLWQAHADHLVENQGKITGGIKDMASAVAAIGAAKAVPELEALRAKLLEASQAGTLSQQQYAQATGLLNTKLKEMKTATAGAALSVSDLSTGLETLKDVQDAISNAKTTVDIQNIRTALNKLYNEGTIKAAEFNREQDALAKKTAELRQAGANGSQGMKELAESTDKATKSLEEQRKEIGENMEAGRKGTSSAKADMDAFAGFFAGVMTMARQPLAQLSAEALATFDNLRGISNSDINIDTSSLDATSESLGRVSEQLALVQGNLKKVGLDGLSVWALETQQASLKIQASFLGQKASLQRMMEDYDSGKTKLKDFLSAAKSARQGMSLLNDSDMRTLEGAIASAEEKVKQLGESSKTTVASLREELAGLQGDQEAIDRSRFAGRKSELQQQLAEAQGSGNYEAVQNLTKALGMLRQIEAETDAKRQREQQQALVDAQKAARESAAQAVEAASPAAVEPMKTLRLVTPTGNVDVGVQDDGTGLLGILQQAGYRTT